MVAALAGFGLVWGWANPGPISSSSTPEGRVWTGSSQVSYRNCAAARAAGAAPLYRGQPGYAPHLDRDNDGIACEPYRRR
ncbi:excalibur calcium-binding domain-containing protein [Microvirga arabica]|nr:excalibur calcium-binding domain-containing protein [Microvirga arabica]MBM1169919.1 excalibur calcium-binding domain-containing protein [Microvirga arabica]